MSINEIKPKMDEYSSFIDTVLGPQLAALESEKAVIQTELDEYEVLGRELRKLASEEPQRIESTVDLGYDTLFCTAVAEQPAYVFVNVGMQFHVEMTVVEAIEFVAKRIDFLKAEHLSRKERKIQEVSTHIDQAKQILVQLDHELQMSR